MFKTTSLQDTHNCLKNVIPYLTLVQGVLWNPNKQPVLLTCSLLRKQTKKSHNDNVCLKKGGQVGIRKIYGRGGCIWTTSFITH